MRPDARSMRWIIACAAVILPRFAVADGPRDNQPDDVRPVPRVGVEVPKADRIELEQGLAILQEQIKSLQQSKLSRTQELLPDVEIFYRAVHDALAYQ